MLDQGFPTVQVQDQQELKDSIGEQLNSLLGIIYALLLVTWFGFGARIGRIGFYVVFAVMVTVSVPMLLVR